MDVYRLHPDSDRQLRGALDGAGEPPAWLTYSPLPPLFLQLFTGLYLFALHYRRRPDAARAGVAP